MRVLVGTTADEALMNDSYEPGGALYGPCRSYKSTEVWVTCHWKVCPDWPAMHMQISVGNYVQAIVEGWAFAYITRVTIL